MSLKSTVARKAFFQYLVKFSSVYRKTSTARVDISISLSSLCFQKKKEASKRRLEGQVTQEQPLLSCETRLSAFLNRSMTANNGCSSLNRGKEKHFLITKVDK